MTFVFGDLTQLLILSYILDFVSDLLIFICNGHFTRFAKADFELKFYNIGNNLKALQFPDELHLICCYKFI